MHIVIPITYSCMYIKRPCWTQSLGQIHIYKVLFLQKDIKYNKTCTPIFYHNQIACINLRSSVINWNVKPHSQNQHGRNQPFQKLGIPKQGRSLEYVDQTPSYHLHTPLQSLPENNSNKFEIIIITITDNFNSWSTNRIILERQKLRHIQEVQ